MSKTNMPTPSAADFSSAVVRIHSAIEGVDGMLTRRETECLAWLGSHATAKGEIVEIGSYRGKSTIVLALASKLAGDARVVAVDPLTSPSITDPVLGKDRDTARSAFDANLASAGVAERVEFHQMFSNDLAASWPAGHKIRLLWIDGDHTYAGAKRDFALFSPFLADGAIVAFHDVLHHHGGPARVMTEDVLLSEHFGAAGLSGSIGWAQYHADSTTAMRLMEAKLGLYRRLSRVISFTAFGGDIEGLRKIGYKLARARAPHGDMDAAYWRQNVVIC